jgi:RimJ/RimL family protein N-acetyltransferase
VRVFLETNRLILREISEADVEPLVALDGDPEVRRYIVSLLPLYPAGWGIWAVQQKDTDDLIGWLHLRPALEYRYAEAAGYRSGDADLGYRMRRSAWGRGFATEGARALIEYAWTRPEVLRVVACSLTNNQASLRVLEKCGLRKRADVKLPEQSETAVMYARER